MHRHHKIITMATAAVLMVAATAHAGTRTTVRPATETVYLQLSGMG